MSEHNAPLFDARVRAIRYAITIGRHAEYVKQPPDSVFTDALEALDALLPDDEFRPAGVRTDCPKTRALADVVVEGLTVMRDVDDDEDSWELPDLVTINRAFANLAALVERAQHAERYRSALRKIAAEQARLESVRRFAQRVLAGGSAKGRIEELRHTEEAAAS